MDSLLDDIAIQVRRCEGAAAPFERPPLSELIERLREASEAVGEAWSGSWAGYQAHVYYSGLNRPPVGVHFNSEWGLHHPYRGRIQEQWQEVAYETVRDEVLRRAGNPDLAVLDAAAETAREVFQEAKLVLVATLEAAIAETGDKWLEPKRDALEKLEDHTSQGALLRALQPSQIMSRDAQAMHQGFRSPHHLYFEAGVVAQASFGKQLAELASLGKSVLVYLEKRHKLKGTSVAKREGKIFIGHGGSTAWRDVKDFISDRLGLDWDEYNRAPTAGMARTERLAQMLDEAVFAFIVLTGEDEAKDGGLRARQNVIHEAGLFQGRLGFRRAIVLLEDGCEEFSNIHGLEQIRFPKGNVLAKSEEIRRVLEREAILR